jgi:hypothetical protein
MSLFSNLLQQRSLIFGKKRMTRLLLLILLFPLFSEAQLSKKDSTWLVFKPFIGDWKGSGTGVDGTGTYERSYRFVLGKNYIEVKNKTVYPPGEKNKNGYTHEDAGYISYDKMRKKFVFRQFHAEGFVNQYRLDSISADGMALLFISEAIENIPAGWRAKEVLTITANSLTEIFYLAQPGKEYEEYTKATLSRTN